MPRSDPSLEQEIRRLLDEKVDLDARQIRVRVRDGVATLEGFTEDAPSRNIAERVVWRVHGISRVENQLLVQDSDVREGVFVPSERVSWWMPEWLRHPWRRLRA